MYFDLLVDFKHSTWSKKTPRDPKDSLWFKTLPSILNTLVTQNISRDPKYSPWSKTLPLTQNQLSLWCLVLYIKELLFSSHFFMVGILIPHAF